MSEQKKQINSNIIDSVKKGSLAWEKGVREGDVISQIDGVTVKDFDDIRKEIHNKKECAVSLSSNKKHKVIQISNISDFFESIEFKVSRATNKIVFFVGILILFIIGGLVIALLNKKPKEPQIVEDKETKTLVTQELQKQPNQIIEEEKKAEEKKKIEEEKKKIDKEIEKEGGEVDNNSFTPPVVTDYDSDAYYDPDLFDPEEENKSGKRTGRSNKKTDPTTLNQNPQTTSDLVGDYTQQSNGETPIQTPKRPIFDKDSFVKYNYGITAKYSINASSVRALENNSKYLTLKRDIADMLEDIDLHINPKYDREKFEYKIYGYTDSQYTIGNTEHNGQNFELNIRISKERADVIKNLLVENGIKESQVMVIPMAYDDPIVDEDGKEVFSESRRVRMEILY